MMERSESTFEQLELKYCERGGGYGCGAKTRSECIAGPAFRRWRTCRSREARVRRGCEYPR